MKSRDRNRVIIIVLILLISIHVISLALDDGEYPTAKICGKPVIWAEYHDFSKFSIDQILSDDEYIYVLYGEHEGFLQVFDLQGVYQYSASFYKHLNGAFSMALEAGTLYVRDCVHNLYIIQDGKFQDFREREEASSLLEKLNFGLQSRTYRVRLGSIWRISGAEEYCIIRRPVQATLYQNDVMFFLGIAIVLLIGLCKPISFFSQKKTSANR